MQKGVCATRPRRLLGARPSVGGVATTYRLERDWSSPFTQERGSSSWLVVLVRSELGTHCMEVLSRQDTPWKYFPVILPSALTNMYNSI